MAIPAFSPGAFALIVALAAAAAGSPAPPAGAALRQAVVVWHRWASPPRAGEVVLIDAAGVLAGATGAPLARKLFAERERVHELAAYARRWRPFALRGAGGELQFRGTGAEPAGAVERRMVREWARMVAAEAQAGARSGVYGLALVWERGDPQARGGEPCHTLQVWLGGTARAGACAGARRRTDGLVRPARMAALYRWIDELAPLQLAAAEGGEGPPVRLLLAAAGRRAAAAPERRAIEDFAAALHTELTAATASPSS
ncbi:MAG TPA: hypothetical protein VF121_05690 [Thermoanaerobaculia bacterium]|nr:hypothetical protein [Thermoanaerobaculia bacterium]